MKQLFPIQIADVAIYTVDAAYTHRYVALIAHGHDVVTVVTALRRR